MMTFKDGANAAFETPIWTKQWPEEAAVNAALKKAIQAKRATSQGVHLSNVGGWHSESDLLKWPGGAVATLASWIQHGFRDMIEQSCNPEFRLHMKTVLTCWANVSSTGAYNVTHNHTPALFSGVYYVDPGELFEPPSKSGLLEFQDPRVLGGPVPSQAFHPPVLLRPKAGMMVIFPGWLMHFVHPYHGAGERISIAFNLRVKSYTLAPERERP